MHISTIIEKNSSDKIRPLSSAEAPPGYPNTNSNNEKKKKESARRTMGKQKKAGARLERSLSLSPSHRPLRALFFLHPTTKRGVHGGESLIRARVTKNSRTSFGNNLDTWRGSGHVTQHYVSVRVSSNNKRKEVGPTWESVGVDFHRPFRFKLDCVSRLATALGHEWFICSCKDHFTHCWYRWPR